MLPRILIAAILINLSVYIVAAMVVVTAGIVAVIVIRRWNSRLP